MLLQSFLDTNVQKGITGTNDGIDLVTKFAQSSDSPFQNIDQKVIVPLQISWYLNIFSFITP
jgi:hypothetical protein